MNSATLKAALDGSPSSNRITPEYLESRIRDATFTRIGDTMTICVMTLDNGFLVTGESACVDPRNYRQDIGEEIARKNAFDKLWPLFGFMLMEWHKLMADGVPHPWR